MKTEFLEQIVEQIENFTRQIIRDEVSLQIKAHSISKKAILPSIQKTKHSYILIGWLQGEKKLLKLYNLLITYGFIICDLNEFKIHFYGTSIEIDKIKWLTFVNQLTLLFDLLYTYDFIPYNHTPHNLIKQHFLNKNGESLNNNCLRSSLNNVRSSVGNKKQNCNSIENIIEKLLKNE